MNRISLSTLCVLSFLAISCSGKRAGDVPNLLASETVTVGEAYDSPFLNRFDVYQDGTVPMYRDANDTLWALSGHSHMGHIGVFRGTSLDDMKEAWPMTLNFKTGNAAEAFSGICYPEGVRPRGSVWPFGLYICPGTGRFFCFFHNETGWNGQGSAYDAFGPCETPAYDSDFRHIGLMHSDDRGKTWDFDRWILTSENVCFTDRYNPGAGSMVGQPSGIIDLGTGDFSTFIEEDGEWIYIIYNKIALDMDKGRFHSVDSYMARTRKRSDGVMGDFVKKDVQGVQVEYIIGRRQADKEVSHRSSGCRFQRADAGSKQADGSPGVPSLSLRSDFAFSAFRFRLLREKSSVGWRLHRSMTAV